ncbi:MAG TPA: class I SAM-dependent methyltransferase [Geminicoccaceae bacterium]|nr:class I SAM-dependent methyltransferase [Geminicoccaceae bacterium]
MSGAEVALGAAAPAGTGPTPFVTLANSGLGIEADEIARLFEPFVLRDSGGDHETWARAVARRKRKLLKATARRLALGWLPSKQRREATVLNEYNRAWATIDYAAYSLEAPQSEHTPWEWRGARMLASDVGATRFRQLLLIRVLERLRPRRVLEVGCGNGINLILLACRLAEISFAGVELTAAGHQAARRLQEETELPPAMRAFAPLPLADPSAFRGIEFRQGNATCLPFADGEFDLVITVLSLEQMERVRPQALREIARVSRRHCLMIEPFRDVNAALWPRLNVLRRDYFQGRIAELREYRLEPVLALADYPQEVFLKTCAVLSERRPA